MGKEIAVVGAGIVGATASYYLARAGYRVTVFDEGIGQATAAAAGIICPWLSRRRNKKWYRLVSEGAAFYGQLMSDLDSDGFSTDAYAQCGTIILGNKTGYIEEVHDRAAERRKAAPMIGTIKILDGEEIQAALPPLVPMDRALFVGGGARVDGQGLTKVLLQAVVSFGGCIRNERITLSKNKDTLSINTLNGAASFDAVILAVGAWLPQALEPLGYTVDVRGQKGQLLVLQTGSPAAKDYPVVMPQGEIDLLPFKDGTVIVGASHENDKGYNLEPDPSVLNPMLEQAVALIPSLKNAEPAAVRVGTRAYTSDFSPFFGNIPGLEQCYTASGLGSSGLTSGPLIGYSLAQMVQGEQTSLDAADYPANHYIIQTPLAPGLKKTPPLE